MITWPAHVLASPTYAVKAAEYVLTAQEVANLLGTKRPTVYQWAQDGLRIPKSQNRTAQVRIKLDSFQPFSQGTIGFSIRGVAMFARDVQKWRSPRDPGDLQLGVGVNWDAIPYELVDKVANYARIATLDTEGGTP